MDTKIEKCGPDWHSDVLAYALIRQKAEMSDIGIKRYNAFIVLIVPAGFPLYHHVATVL